MIGRVIFRPAAEADLKEAYEWYEQRAAGLGVECVRCVDSCVQLIRRHPEIYPMIQPLRKVHVSSNALSIQPVSGSLWFINTNDEGSERWGDGVGVQILTENLGNPGVILKLPPISRSSLSKVKSATGSTLRSIALPAKSSINNSKLFTSKRGRVVRFL